MDTVACWFAGVLSVLQQEAGSRWMSWTPGLRWLSMDRMPPWLTDVLTNAGPTAAIMGYMWYTERRRADDMTRQLLESLKEQNAINAAVRDVLKKKSRGSGGGAGDES